MTITLEPGHRAVVIGAAGAIGAAVCRGYAAAGAAVTALDLDGPAARAVIGSLPGGGHAAGALDVTGLGAVEAAAQDAAAAGVSSLCYAAGIAPTFEVLDFDWAAYRRTMAINLDGALHCAYAFGRKMAAAGGGSMTFISSAAGKQGAAGAAAYCASKFALRGVVESFAGEVGEHGIRVNAICPGEVDSPMLTRVAQAQAARRGTDPKSELRDWGAAAALRRLVQPHEVAATAVWLASAHASAITGASIDVTAGLGPA